MYPVIRSTREADDHMDRQRYVPVVRDGKTRYRRVSRRSLLNLDLRTPSGRKLRY